MSRRLYDLIARVMDIDVSTINDDSSPETIPSWDSFNSYVLLDELTLLPEHILLIKNFLLMK